MRCVLFFVHGLLFAVCCSWCAVCSSLVVVRRPLCAGCWLWFVGLVLAVCVVIVCSRCCCVFAVCCLLVDVDCALRAACCALCGVSCVLFDECCLLFVVWRLLYVEYNVRVLFVVVWWVLTFACC